MAITVLCLLALVVASQALPYDLKPQILNGQIAAEGQFPYQVSIAVKVGQWVIDLCGGAIISENYVLTSALCLIARTAEELTVIAGTIDIENRKFTYEVEKVIYHPLLNFDFKKNDIALLKLKKSFDKVSTIQSIALPTKTDSLKVGDVATVSGWGKHKKGEVADRHLRYASVVISDLDECRKIYKNDAYKIYDANVCAYKRGADVGPCFGDEGGPLTFNGKLVGFVSWSINHCADGNIPFVYTNVSSYLDWIKENAV
ncbi:chymotrypsin-2-like [Prorops nasuta]|uniref:chymotrypsin-2-like n=1 Tax=Prorops nasuta TaxID=863751 RepID=UPI0034CE0E4A